MVHHRRRCGRRARRSARVLRVLVSASNLAFVFLALTLIVAEMGGRGPALATAVVSALSLNFFLTEPYMSLEIHKPGDLVAFLRARGMRLIAAAFGKRRVRTAEQVTRTRGDLEVLGRIARGLAAREPIDQVLEDLRRSFGLGGLVLRRGDERLIAAAPATRGKLPASLDPARPVHPGRRQHTGYIRWGAPGSASRGRRAAPAPRAASPWSSTSGREAPRASPWMSGGHSPSALHDRGRRPGLPRVAAASARRRGQPARNRISRRSVAGFGRPFPPRSRPLIGLFTDP